ncbi:MAG: glycosyltransferase family 4 protein [Actinomycetota bacterium]
MSRVLVLTLDRVGQQMAGPAIRAFEIAKHLAHDHEVHLLATATKSHVEAFFQISDITRKNLAGALAWADVVIFQGYVFHLYPEIRTSGNVLVCDLYDPMHLESLEMNRQEREGRRLAIAASDLSVVNDQIVTSDFFICASEKQRDFWLGQLASLGRLNPFTYDEDPSLRKLIVVAPFGIPSAAPSGEGMIKGVIPGIAKTDKVLIWGGGIYNWFDPLTLIRAVAETKQKIPNLRLLFMGTGHPNPEVPQMHVAVKAKELSDELELTDKHVFFNPGWVPYEMRGQLLADADIGVSCHYDHIETDFSYRTRVLDYFWAGLPVIVTSGDQLSRMVEDRGLGLTVPPEDVSVLARSIQRLIEDQQLIQDIRGNIEKLRPELTWDVALKPLAVFCKAPRRAPDLISGQWPLSATPSSNPFRLINRVARYWRRGGWELVRVQTRKYFARRQRF